MPGGQAATRLIGLKRAMRWSRGRAWLAAHRLEAGLTLRMSAAGLISFAIGDLLGLVQIYWAVLTAVIVTQASIGGSLKAMLDRLVGTIGGAAWGVAVTLAVPHPTALSTGIALAVALVPLAAAASVRPNLRIAPVTAAIVLLGYSAQTEVVAAALQRVFEIGLGSIVALAVALLVTPARAHELLCMAGRDALAVMGELVELLLAGVAAPLDPAAVQDLQDRIRTAVERCAAAADEAARERRSYLTEAPDPDPLVRTLRRLSHDLVIVARALMMPLPEIAAGRLAQPAAAIGAAVAAAFTRIGDSLVGRADPPDLAPFAAVRAAFDAELAAMRRERVTQALPELAVERIFGLAFALEQISGHLDEFVARAREMAQRD
jgi:uncharacterized membrane protein YccC